MSALTSVVFPEPVPPAITMFRRLAIASRNAIAWPRVTRGQAIALRDAIAKRQNIVIAGGTGTGKTTLVNALIHEMVTLGHQAERFVIIEDTLELQCAARNALQLHTTDAADMTRLVRATMRLRPDRIIIGEVRG